MKTLTEQDYWLLKHWRAGRQLEDCMNAVRQRYVDLFGEVHQQVKKCFPEVDRWHSHMTPREIREYGGNVIFSKSDWPYTSTTWRTGFYIGGISLDELTAENPPAPDAYIWLSVDKETDKRIDNLRRRLAAKAPHIFKNRRIQWSQQEEDNQTCLWYPFRERPSELLAMLTKDEKSFVDCIAKHVKLLSEFIPDMDEVLSKGKST
jgi:hypothetical protein